VEAFYRGGGTNFENVLKGKLRPMKPQPAEGALSDMRLAFDQT
jgi:hypothetical protein